ncbi:MAG TPA: ABC transporter ATP-binding protein [Kiritimatiellia bacterium]|nr:ABC transporter ATP-binding protein [Kiritimatiellia bacterium]
MGQLRFPPSPENILEVRELSVSFRTEEGVLRAVDNLSLDIRRGEVLGLVGESGCGKTVTAMSLLRLIPQPPGQIETGHVWYDGKDLLALPSEELRTIRGKDISMIFQEPMTALSPLHRIGKQLVETQQLHLAIGKEEAWRNGVDWLGRVGISDPEERMLAYPHQLSGGMRQRVMIAMALILEPKLIIADEPTTALDVTIQAQILQLLLAMKDKDTSVLLITHDMGIVWETCDRLAVMYAAEIVEQGPVDALFSRPAHPYTQALLRSIPALAGGRTRLETIAGSVPTLYNLPGGCRFRNRCRFAEPVCAEKHPMLESLGQHRHSRCLLAREVMHSGKGGEG